VPTSGDLVQIVAAHLALSPETVGVHLRNIRVAGFITKRGFGRGAAAMTPGDAARLLLAASGSAFAKDSIETVEGFGRLKPAGRQTSERRPRAHGDPYVFPGPTFEASLKAKIWRLRREAYSADAVGVYRDDFVDANSVRGIGVPAVQLFSCFVHGRSTPVRAAVLRHFDRDEIEAYSFAEFRSEVFDERAFYVAAGFPGLVQVRSISPRALAQIARSL